MISLSKDVESAEALRRSLVVYRMAFGQSRQDDLVMYLQQYLTAEQIKQAIIELKLICAHPQRTGRNQVYFRHQAIW